MKRLLLLLLAVLAPATSLNAQTSEGLRRAAVERDLRALHAELKRSYFDPGFKGNDIEKLYQQASEAVKRANSLAEMQTAVVKYLDVFDDSHTYYIPDRRISLSDFGFSRAWTTL